MAKTSERSVRERRQYIRLDSVFPVCFRFLSYEKGEPLSDWLQGFTNNVGKGGICLAVNNLKSDHAKKAGDKQAKISLEIEMPVFKKPVCATADISWVQEIDSAIGKYLIGLRYLEIDVRQNNKIIRYARLKKLFIPVTLGVIIILGLTIGAVSFMNAKLVKDNKALVEQLVSVTQESTLTKQEIEGINREKSDLAGKIQDLAQRIAVLEGGKDRLEEKALSAESKNQGKIKELNGLIAKMNQEKVGLEGRLISTQKKARDAAKGLVDLDQRRIVLEKANIENMYKWLKVHQNPRTGLVMSFEGDGEIADWAFTYDQALLVQAYAYFSDFSRAKKILEFFAQKAKRENNKFFNAYYAADGEPAEYVAHGGPNIWLGIAIVQYTHKSGDKSYLKLAEEIAAAIIRLQDNEGGIPGGENITWYSTEHNLDAYAFFQMLYKITGKGLYRDRAGKVLDWLVANTYNKVNLPVKRGKGDSTIATDTYAWSIAAIGPQKLEALGMNPERIMEFAEQNCMAEVNYLRPDGKNVVVRGFDFAAQKNLARGGIVSSEWSAQMVMSFKIMADYYNKKNMPDKARAYAAKADGYLSALSNMIISSPSPSGQGESCLPYATQEHADTGHGWMTPKGKSTGSVAGTSYTIFAYYNYNPLELKD